MKAWPLMAQWVALLLNLTLKLRPCPAPRPRPVFSE